MLFHCLAGLPGSASTGFHLFPETADPPLVAFRVGLEGLPPAAPLTSRSGAPAPAAPRGASSSVQASLPPYRTEKNFGLAAAELVGLTELLPWTVNRLARSPWAYISTATVRYNLQTGFIWDNDSFATNQASHSYHGSVYFNAARTNGFSFWESAPFVVAGSFLWEMFLENQPASINDVVNTTLGGMVFGEVQFRTSNMIYDNTASGLQRLLREVGGFVVNPIGGVNRLIHGEMWKDFQNPPDRLPSRLYIELDGVYRHGSGPVPDGEGLDQGGLSFLMRYGDPFEGVHRHPFEYFDVSVSLLTPHSAFITEIEARGLLVDRKLSASPSAEQRLGLFLGTSYFNHGESVYGAQAFSAAHMLMVPLGKETELRTEAGLLGMPIIGVGVDYPRENAASTSGVTYNFGAGFGAQASARVRRREVDLLVLAWSLVGQRASNGISKSSRIQAVSAEARLPLTRNLVLGGGWSWGERITTYDRLPTVDSSGTAWRVFAGWAIPTRPGPPDPTAERSSSSAAPNRPGPWSVSAFGGQFVGSRVRTGPELNVLMLNAPTYGLRLGYEITRVFSLEAGWSRVATQLRPESPSTGEPLGPTTPVTVNTYELDALFGFGGASVRGYFGVGAGAQDIHPSVPSLDGDGATARFAANIALGGLYFLTPALAIRAEGRYRFRASDKHLGAIGCDYTGCTPYATNVFSSAEITGGLTVRF